MTWEAGDLAVCVENGFVFDCPCGHVHDIQSDLVGGASYVVQGFRLGNYEKCGEPHVIIGNRPRLASRFRKVRPDAHEGEMHDWELLLDQCSKRKRVSA